MLVAGLITLMMSANAPFDEFEILPIDADQCVYVEIQARRDPEYYAKCFNSNSADPSEELLLQMQEALINQKQSYTEPAESETIDFEDKIIDNISSRSSPSDLLPKPILFPNAEYTEFYYNMNDNKSDARVTTRKQCLEDEAFAERQYKSPVIIICAPREAVAANVNVVLDQLKGKFRKKFKRLRDEGDITPEEYERIMKTI